MHTQVLLLLGLFGLAFGQFHLREDGIYDGNILLYVVPDAFGDSRITMCYTGDTVFLFEGNPRTNVVTLYQLKSDDNYATSSVVRTFSSGLNYPSVDCCCQYLAYGYADTLGSYRVVIVRTDNFNIYKEFNINEVNVGNGVVTFDCQTQLLRVVYRAVTYEFDVSQPGASHTNIYRYPALTNAPRCAGFVSNGGTEYLILSFEDRPLFEVISLNTAVQEMYTLNVGGQSLKTSCLDVDGTTIHFFARDTGSSTGYILRQDISSILADIDKEITVFATPIFSFVLFGIKEFYNGLSVCTGCDTLPCLTTQCDCAVTDCGFCTPGDPASCACADSREAGCVYLDTEVATTCVVPFTRVDASCVVLNPIADRRAGGDVNIGLVVSGSETTGITQIDIRRAAKTGRWPNFLLPKWQNLAITGNLQLGYRMPVQANARGRRFGIFDTVITRNDAIVENIFCITTERSGFRNQVFTQVCVEGSSCQLSASMDNMKFLQEVRWRRTDLETGVVTDFSEFDGSLTLTITPVSKLNHQGVYEVYRVKRYLRTWHPIIYLYVRECPTGSYGALCNNVCPNCNSGICDVRTGQCRCYPGFTGTNCELACETAALIGQSCDIDCNSIFSGTAGDDCLNLEICNGDDLGCQCRSGLQLPECTDSCPAGTWGTNCAGFCSCTLLQSCDPRVGCI